MSRSVGHMFELKGRSLRIDPWSSDWEGRKAKPDTAKKRYAARSRPSPSTTDPTHATPKTVPVPKDVTMAQPKSTGTGASDIRSTKGIDANRFLDNLEGLVGGKPPVSRRVLPFTKVIQEPNPEKSVLLRKAIRSDPDLRQNSVEINFNGENGNIELTGNKESVIPTWQKLMENLAEMDTLTFQRSLKTESIVLFKESLGEEINKKFGRFGDICNFAASRKHPWL